MYFNFEELIKLGGLGLVGVELLNYQQYGKYLPLTVIAWFAFSYYSGIGWTSQPPPSKVWDDR